MRRAVAFLTLITTFLLLIPIAPVQGWVDPPYTFIQLIDLETLELYYLYASRVTYISAIDSDLDGLIDYLEFRAAVIASNGTYIGMANVIVSAEPGNKYLMITIGVDRGIIERVIIIDGGGTTYFTNTLYYFNIAEGRYVFYGYSLFKGEGAKPFVAVGYTYAPEEFNRIIIF